MIVLRIKARYRCKDHQICAMTSEHPPPLIFSRLEPFSFVGTQQYTRVIYFCNIKQSISFIHISQQQQGYSITISMTGQLLSRCHPPSKYIASLWCLKKKIILLQPGFFRKTLVPVACMRHGAVLGIKVTAMSGLSVTG